MTSFIKSVAAVVGISAAASAPVFANGGFNPVPEPGSLALVVVAIGAAALVSRKGKK